MTGYDDLLSAIGDNDKVQGVQHWCDTGYPPLNKAISGHYDRGMPVGRMVEMFGPPSSGKTAIATSVMASAQRAGGIGAFFDHERSFDASLGADLGLDLTPGKWIFKTPDTFEQSVDMAVMLGKIVREKGVIPADAPIVCVFDSLASMVPQSKLIDKNGNQKGAEDNTMHDSMALAKATSTSFPVLQLQAEKLGMLMLFLNQMREKPGVAFGDPTTTPGGKAPEFYASVRIQLGRKMIKVGRDVIGQTVTARCTKNKVSAPFKEAEWDFKFLEDGSGYFDVIGGTIDHLKGLGALEVAGAYIVWDGKKYHKATLIDKIINDGLEDQLMALLPK